MSRGRGTYHSERQAPIAARLFGTIETGVNYVFSQQRPDGSWVDHLPSSPVSTGAALMALHASDRETYALQLSEGAAWLRYSQNPDGSWGDTPGGEGTLHATAIAVAALKVVAADTSHPALRRGLGYLERSGGSAVLEDRSQCALSDISLNFLAVAGLYPFRRLRRMPLEVVLMPQSLRRKLSFTMPGLLAWGVMQAHTQSFGPCQRLVNRLAEPKALRWLEGIQALESYKGGFEESPLLVAVVWFGLARAGVGRVIANRCRDYLLATRRPDGSWPVNRDLEFSASMFLLMGLQELGYGHDSRLDRTRQWILQCQRQDPFFPTGCPAGGWGWSLPSGWPNTDDTSSALMVLPKLGVPREAQPIRAGVDWLLSMQNGDGSWGCFVRGGKVSLDKPCPVFTAHALVALRESARLTAAHPAVARGLDYLAKVQRPDGSVHALWYRNYTAGTAAVLDTYARYDRAGDHVAKRCKDWLLRHQHEEGCWNGGSREQPSVEETAWALIALLSAGLPATNPRIQRTVVWLADRQEPYGGWRPSVIGVYMTHGQDFASLMYHDNHIANGLVLQALGRYQCKLGTKAS